MWKNVPKLSIYVEDGLASPRDRRLSISLTVPYSETGLEMQTNIIKDYLSSQKTQTEFPVSISFVETGSECTYTQNIRRYLEAFLINDISKIIVVYWDEFTLSQTIRLLDDVLKQQMKKVSIPDTNYESQLVKTGYKDSVTNNSQYPKCTLHLLYDSLAVVDFRMDGRFVTKIDEFIKLPGQYTFTIQVRGLRMKNYKWSALYYLKGINCSTAQKLR